MQYLLLIYDSEATWEKTSPADQAKMYEEYGKFTNEIKAKGNHLAGHQLKPVATAEPSIDGTIAVKLPTRVSSSIRPVKRLPI